VAVQFGYNLSTAVVPGGDPVAEAREAEVLGYDFVSVSDHLHGASPTWETWTYLTWVAAATERVAVVPNVLGLPYRAPAVLAKMAETLQRLSGGRLVLGYGAGGMDAEFRAFGLDVRTPAAKVEALADALTILRGTWTATPYTYEGSQLSVHDARLEPKPEQPIPVWIGGNGPRVLALTGRLADGWIPSVPFAPPEVIPERAAVVLRAAEASGRSREDLTFVYNVGIALGHRGDDPTVVSGGPEEIAERLGSFAALGFDAINVWPAGNAEEQRHRVAEEVLPLLR
jgi:alkanesulfonate monooxygenase SsuD/methylene tetrahydromethanopterin reductase-like flavin-dependent oxidoreductase (luciferase family)